jgi:hypothetical protein
MPQNRLKVPQGFELELWAHGLLGVRAMARANNGKITQREPLLHEVDAQHGVHLEGRPALHAFKGVRRNQRHQTCPRDDRSNLSKEFPLARSRGAQVVASTSFPDKLLDSLAGHFYL